MLRAVINGQSVLKGKLLEEIQEVKSEIIKLKKEITDVESRLTARLDVIGLQVANLEDDAASREDLEELEMRVKSLEPAKSAN